MQHIYKQTNKCDKHELQKFITTVKSSCALNLLCLDIRATWDMSADQTTYFTLDSLILAKMLQKITRNFRES